ncbi:DNA polymerase III subunit gamma and tau, partial [Streptomyces sp. NPDC060027]
PGPPATAAGRGRRPGGWPTATPAGGGQAPAQPAPAPAATPAPPAAAPGAPQAPAGPPAAGGLDPRTLWPNILEAVKNRRRFTWILLSQNAQVTAFDGTTLQIGFVNAGARDNFASSGSEDVLRQALAEQFNVQWKVEAIVDASGGSVPPAAPAGSGFGGGGGYGGGGGGYGGGGGGAGGYGGSPAGQRPAPQQSSAPASQPPAPQSGPSAGHTQGRGMSAPASAPSPAHEPPPVAPEDDTPEDDDPDLDESALSGHDLIVRELGATVLEEFSNE